MPEHTDRICDYLESHAKWEHDLIVVDNASDLVEPAKHTTYRLPKNIQTTGGFLVGLNEADRLARKKKKPYFAYWFIVTSVDFPAYMNDDPMSPLVELLLADDNAVAVQPALTKDSTTPYKHLITRGGDKPERTWLIDNMASMYRADWFDSIGRFNKQLTFAWGLDRETCYKARQQGRGIYIHEGVKVRFVRDIAYSMDRMNMEANDRHKLASRQVAEVFETQYGSGWLEILHRGCVSEGMRR